MNRDLIEKFAADADVPKRAIEGLTKADLLAHPIPGMWSIQELIVHLMESHVTAAMRMRKIIAEDNPLITAYDESLFVKRLYHDKMDAAMACELFRLNQLMTAELLRQLPDAAFARTGIHTETGKITLGSMLAGYVDHVDHHMKFLREKRKALGKPLAW